MTDMTDTHAPAPSESEASPAVPADGPDPWEGIPAELLDGGRAYDTDTAGGCG
ncbi:hypothetical protein [Actinomadura opuntiae]|uniref:hypothetical protein n=1 Tax=Actinomadura sp. OS1-43 TaxID=604315 RepID=UPI00255AAF21|nr:hypothetical protein [Actinomadura sp. OS1-43]MDL4820273.1 hypothetical protein [Actinomadura sp. OS1-43]